MTATQSRALLLPVAVLAAIAQLLTAHWGLAGILAGGLIAGGFLLSGDRLLAIDFEHVSLLPLIAAAASLLGLLCAKAGSGAQYPHVAWIAPLLAAAVPGVPALYSVLRAKKCQLCQTSLRSLLSFKCPRCHMNACENCWQFERDRCRLCDINQIALFPIDHQWWQDRFGSPAQSGRCALCLRMADWNVAHWPCVNCGHSQCRLCWDDNNGQCSRCNWMLPGLPPEAKKYAPA